MAYSIAKPELDDDVAAIARIDAVATILKVVCRTTGMGFAAVARVTEDRWVACGVLDEIEFGLEPGGELDVETTLCNEIRMHGNVVVIDHVEGDEVYCGHPTPAKYGFQSYISVPIRRKSGEFFGTLCAIDPRPARLNTPETIGMFQLFADLVGFHLDFQEQLASSEAALLSERQVAELREQFIAVLGHDLRNPLASIDAGVRLLGRRMPADEQAGVTLALIQKSVGRMTELIDDVLDLARGRLGGGLTLERLGEDQLDRELAHVVAELRSAWPQRSIEAEIELGGTVRCDRARIGQLLSNLLANALSHGAPDQPVRVSASLEGGIFELSVANGGPPIPAQLLPRLFQPFIRSAERSAHGGLGLGLYIASEIARAHSGTLTVSSDATETRFTFRMPA